MSEASNERYAMLRLGLACNVACPFCNVPVESYPYPLKLSLDHIRAEIDRFRAEGARTIHISGGEPTIRPDLADIIRYARESGMTSVELQTNGILLRKRHLVDKLARAGLTSAFVGLHSHLSQVHDVLVQSHGAFEACVEGVRHLIAEGVQTTLNPVLTIANYKTLPDFMRFIVSELPGVYSISLSVVQPHGRAWGNRKLLPRYGELSPYVERAVEFAEASGLIVNNPFCGLPLCIGGWHKRLSRCVEPSEAQLGRAPGDGEKVHVAACAKCALQNLCGGVWKEYPSLHPIADLVPVSAAVLS